MVDTITLTQAVLDEMISHARELAPVECCGYVAGQDGVADLVIKMTNIDNSPEHFSFDPKEQFSSVKTMRQQGKSLMVVYHSHPESPARLSEEDLRLLIDPDMVYIIVSLLGDSPDVKAFRTFEGQSVPVNLHIQNQGV